MPYSRFDAIIICQELRLREPQGGNEIDLGNYWAFPVGVTFLNCVLIY